MDHIRMHQEDFEPFMEDEEVFETVNIELQP